MASRRKPKRTAASHAPETADAAGNAQEAAPTSAAPGAWQLLRAWPTGPWVPMLLLWALLPAIGLHVLHVFTGPPNFDEHFHLQFLWLTWQGILPRDGFLCPYPPTAYYLFAPLLRLLPQTPDVFLGLRWLTLIPCALFAAAIAVLARACGRPAALATAWIMVGLASDAFPAFWEIRFDALAWALVLLALVLVLRTDSRKGLAAAAALTSLSVLLAPKHAFMATGLAVGVGLHRLATAPRGVPRDLLAALAGAAAPVLVMLLLRPAFLSDAWDLTLLNIRTQAASRYPVELLESILNLIVDQPLVTAHLWLGPVLFLLQFSELPVKVRWIFSAILAGNLATLVALPCGYTQYTSLIWAIFAPFVIWMIPAAGSRLRALAMAIALAWTVAGYAGRDSARLREESLLDQQVRLQRELARICPPGEIDSAGPFGHTWCRGIPGYVFIDNRPSYGNLVRPARRHFFSEAYYLAQLEAHPPAFDLPFTTTDNQPETYLQARLRFLDRHATNYIYGTIPYSGHAALKDQRIGLFVRKDRVPFATQFTPGVPR